MIAPAFGFDDTDREGRNRFTDKDHPCAFFRQDWFGRAFVSGDFGV